MSAVTALAPESKLELLLEHHRDTFTQQREYIRRRDRLFLFALVAAVAIFFRSADATGSDRLLAILIDKLAGPQAWIDRGFLAVFLAFAFFAVVTRYLQASITVERQYGYLARLEGEISELYGNDVLCRESKGYLVNYPWFSTWMHVLYTWFFPGAVVLLAFANSASEYAHPDVTGWSRWGVLGLSAVTILTVVLFICSSKIESAPQPESIQSAAVTAPEDPNSETVTHAHPDP